LEDQSLGSHPEQLVTEPLSASHATVEREVDMNEGKLLWSMVFSGYFCPLQSMSGVYKLEADLYPFQSFILLSLGVKNCLMQVTGISVLSRQVRFCSAWITAHYLSNTRLLTFIDGGDCLLVVSVCEGYRQNVFCENPLKNMENNLPAPVTTVHRISGNLWMG
jgi:hypothetical protein